MADAVTQRDYFICHAAEDKDDVARPICDALKERGYEVWFDEYELVLGDSLRERIDQGLASSRFGVVVLSRRFFEKKWALHELNGLFAKEMVGDERLVFPVWHEIDEEFLVSVSPSLADRIGVPSRPVAGAVQKIIEAFERRGGAGNATVANATAQRLLVPGPELTPEPLELVEAGTRVRLGQSPKELKRDKRKADRPGKDGRIPMVGKRGWLSVIVGPVRLQADLIDSTEIKADDLRHIEIDDQWSKSWLANQGVLRPTIEGFDQETARSKVVVPNFWFKLWHDGLMEHGVVMDRRARRNPDEPTRAIQPDYVAEDIHDYSLLFLKILEHVGYDGEVVAIASFHGIAGYVLEVPDMYRRYKPPTISVAKFTGRPLRGSVAELPEQVDHWTRKTMDRLFFAAGVDEGWYTEIDSDFRLRDRQGRIVA